MKLTSLSNGNETMVKRFMKKEGRNGGKRLKGWVEKQPKKKTKITGKDNVGKKFSQVTFFLYKFTFISYD
jgi:hypothetical protein